MLIRQALTRSGAAVGGKSADEFQAFGVGGALTRAGNLGIIQMKLSYITRVNFLLLRDTQRAQPYVF